MIRTILISLAVAVAIILLILWFISGGVRKTIEAAEGIVAPFPLSSSSAGSFGTFRLPWQPEELTRGPDISAMEESASGESAPETPSAELSAAESDYEKLQRQAEEAQTFGTPSPYRGEVRIGDTSGAENGVGSEYVEIEAPEDNTAPIDLAGWSLQSAATGVRAFFPRGAGLFILGAVNEERDVSLDPGASAIVASGPSPVGASFRENLCTGYLGQFQSFTPSLPSDCPAPAGALPETPSNLRAMGEACFNFVRLFPPCTLPLHLPPSVNGACRLFLLDHLSYDGCVADNRYKSSFLKNSWRIYLGAYGELWQNSHDIIRLLDARGRTVDVVTY